MFFLEMVENQYIMKLFEYKRDTAKDRVNDALERLGVVLDRAAFGESKKGRMIAESDTC